MLFACGKQGESKTHVRTLTLYDVAKAREIIVVASTQIQTPFLDCSAHRPGRPTTLEKFWPDLKVATQKLLLPIGFLYYWTVW